jgi:hypothetical protein
MDNSTLLLLLLVSDAHDFYLSLEMTSCLGQLRYEERDFWKVCVGPGVRNAGKVRVQIGRSYIYMLLRMHRKPQLNLLNFYYTLSIVHFKASIRMVT